MPFITSETFPASFVSAALQLLDQISKRLILQLIEVISRFLHSKYYRDTLKEILL